MGGGCGMSPQPIPLRPDPLAHRSAVMTSLSRAAIATAARAIDAFASNKLPQEFLSERGWGNDHLATLIARSASAPAMTTVTGWAADLAQAGKVFLEALRPMSAAADLLTRVLAVNLD